MNFFAIREKGTHKYLPQHNGKGQTHQEPTYLQPPRLFVKRAGAARALAWWKKGIATKEVYTGYNWEVGYDEYDEDPVVSTPVPEREGMEMEIVELKLTEVST